MARGTDVENRNFLSPTGFKFVLKRSPKVAFFCNEINIPDLTLGISNQPTRLGRNIPQPGNNVDFGDLNLRFIVDEDLGNYMEIQRWIRGLGYPESLKEFHDLEDSRIINTNYINDNQDIYSDGTLQVLNSSMISNFQVFFRDLFPYSLGTLTFDATATDIQYFTADVSFKYTIYNITDLSGNPL